MVRLDHDTLKTSAMHSHYKHSTALFDPLPTQYFVPSSIILCNPLARVMTHSPAKMPSGRKTGRQTSISDFFTRTPPRPPKRRSTQRSPARVDDPVTENTLNPPSDAMPIEPPSDPSKQLTQEELHVHDQLESLECSQECPPATAVDDTDETPPRGGDPSEEDDSDDSIADMQREIMLRRSTRVIREVVRFGSQLERPRGTSVFGTAFSNTKSSGNDLKSALREVTQKAKVEERLREIRREVDEAGKVGKDETLFQEMAKAEERAEQIRKEAQDKYSAPLPLFSRKVSMKSLSKQQKRKRSGTFASHPVHDLIVQALKNGDENSDVALSFVAPAVKRYCRSGETRGLANVAVYIFTLAIFDPTDDKRGTLSRDSLLQAIEDIMRADADSFRSVPRFQSVISVLENYGAVFDDKSDLRKVGEVEMIDESLDQQVPMSDIMEKDDKEDVDEKENGKTNRDDNDPPPVSDEFNRCERNLGRLFRIAALQVRYGVPLGRVISNETLGLHESVLFCLGVCTRVLCSAFGNRLYYDVGKLIDESIALIDEGDWPAFRMKAAAYMHSFTARLELHVELVTYLLPYTMRRSRCLGLDIAYLSLQQWCSSNMASRITIDPSARAREAGIESVSFCLSDVVKHVQAIPDLTMNTDMVWVSLLARLLKVLLSEGSVLERRMTGEFGALKKIVVKMRVTTRRLGLDVPVQRMRIALDAIERIMQAYAQGSERKELGMSVERKPRQGSLESMRLQR